MAKRFALALAFALLVVVGAGFVAFGRFNIDEGMHLNAGRLIYERGWLPYRDFPFSQGPGGPFLYGAAGAVQGTSLLVGRCLSLALNLGGVAALAAVAARFAGLPGALLLLGFTLVNFPAFWAFSQVRTEPPALALAGFATLAWFGRQGSVWRAALAPCLLAWATGVRLTYALPLLVACAVAAFELRRSPRRLALAAALVLVNAALAWWPMAVAPEQTWFHVVTSQLDRAERLGWSHLPFAARFWFFARPDEGFWAILLASGLPLLLLARRARRNGRPHPLRDDPASAVAALLAMALLSYAPALRFRGPFFQYFVNASLLLTAAIAIALPMLLRAGGRVRAGSAAVAALAWLGGLWLALAHAQSFIDPGGPTVRRLAPLRERVRQLAPEGCSMLTFQTHVAVELGCDVTPGLEYSYFSFFPTLGDAEARAHGVLNRRLLIQALNAGPELVALAREDVQRISGRPPPARGPARLAAMGNRYRPLERLVLPVLPLETSRVEIFVYVRADLRADGPS